MLYGKKEYIVEFTDAAIDSFAEFNHDFNKYLTVGDLEGFRRAGHKIKPILELLGIEIMLDCYEKGKEILREENTEIGIEKIIDKVSKTTQQVIKELNEISAAD